MSDALTSNVKDMSEAGGDSSLVASEQLLHAASHLTVIAMIR